MYQEAIRQRQEDENATAIELAYFNAILPYMKKVPPLSEFLPSRHTFVSDEDEQDKILFGLGLVSAGLPAKSWDEWQQVIGTQGQALSD